MVALIATVCQIALALVAGATAQSELTTTSQKPDQTVIFGSQNLPFPRVRAIAKTGDQWLLGGSQGLVLGRPGERWKTVSDQSVRQILTLENESWVLYGNGSVDKLDLQDDRLFFDVLNGAVKRPQASALAQTKNGLTIGLYGGFVCKSPLNNLTETYPDLLNGQPITALCEWQGRLVLGTQSGLYVYPHQERTKQPLQKYSFTQGLPDVWVTALLPLSDRLFVATASGGLVTLKDDKIEPVPCPSKRIRSLALWNGKVVVGALEGCFAQDANDQSSTWQQLASEEATCLQVIDGDLYLGQPDKILIFKSTQKSQPKGQGVK